MLRMWLKTKCKHWELFARNVLQCADLRVGDVTSKLRSYCYQDLLQKPSEVLLYRRPEEGGLALPQLQNKAIAHLISTFIQTAASTRFRNSLFHSWMFRFHVQGETNLPDPGYTPYYDQKFFKLSYFDILKLYYCQAQSQLQLCRTVNSN